MQENTEVKIINHDFHSFYKWTYNWYLFAFVHNTQQIKCIYIHCWLSKSHYVFLCFWKKYIMHTKAAFIW